MGDQEVASPTWSTDFLECCATVLSVMTSGSLSCPALLGLSLVLGTLALRHCGLEVGGDSSRIPHRCCCCCRC